MEKWGATLNKLQHKQLKLFLVQKNVLYNILKVLRNSVGGKYRKLNFTESTFLNQNLIYNMTESTFQDSTLGFDKQTTSLIINIIITFTKKKIVHICAARSHAVASCGRALYIMFQACVSQSAAVCVAVKSDDPQELVWSWRQISVY